jgi:hypothetical protein
MDKWTGAGVSRVADGKVSGTSDRKVSIVELAGRAKAARVGSPDIPPLGIQHPDETLTMGLLEAGHTSYIRSFIGVSPLTPPLAGSLLTGPGLTFPRLPRLGSPFSRASLCRKQARREAITFKSLSAANKTNRLAVDRMMSVSLSV